MPALTSTMISLALYLIFLAPWSSLGARNNALAYSSSLRRAKENGTPDNANMNDLLLQKPKDFYSQFGNSTSALSGSDNADNTDNVVAGSDPGEYYYPAGNSTGGDSGNNGDGPSDTSGTGVDVVVDGDSGTGGDGNGVGDAGMGGDGDNNGDNNAGPSESNGTGGDVNGGGGGDGDSGTGGGDNNGDGPLESPPPTTKQPTPSPTVSPTKEQKTQSPTQAPLPTESPTRYPTRNPTTQPTTEAFADKVKDQEEKIKRLANDKTAEIMGALIAFFGVIGMIFTAWQLFENPDGLCASCCRLSIKGSSFLLKIICLPCKLCCGRYAGYTSSDPKNRTLFVEEYTNDLELT